MDKKPANLNKLKSWRVQISTNKMYSNRLTNRLKKYYCHVCVISTSRK